jgi:hypothetical protein
MQKPNEPKRSRDFNQLTVWRSQGARFAAGSRRALEQKRSRVRSSFGATPMG